MSGLDPATIIAIMTLMTGLGFLFNLMLSPIKKTVNQLDTRLTRLEQKLTHLEQKIDQLLSKSA